MTTYYKELGVVGPVYWKENNYDMYVKFDSGRWMYWCSKYSNTMSAHNLQKITTEDLMLELL